MAFRSPMLLLSTLVVILAMSMGMTAAFAPPASSLKTAPVVGVAPASTLFVFGNKKKEEDLSDIESRDMTREEMIALNKKNEEIMNMELSMMTAFSLVISLPILYLCWVAFFSD
eukprot:CAMPEP_0198115790 /NCGR_PEP_ID=MMETSP1442-20131203/7222_1 /TAXON_ID= /ORGANISM="Craspedostauros australis, Strain CCMP3328" /LENGTH=113 /DNA_ID=CAMNT_0043773365 /DNA_START=99 /DNA_END=440 /DNA_ORIENTATION=-